MQEAVSTGAVTCGTNCVRGEWPMAHTVVVALQRGARSVGRWLTFFAGFRFDSVSVSGDDDEAVLLEDDEHAHPRSSAGCRCRGHGCRRCRPARDWHAAAAARAHLCGCICQLGRRSVDEADLPAGPVAEGRFGRGERSAHSSAREGRGQPSVVPEYGASLAGFGSDQMDLMGGVIGMELERLTPQRQGPAAPKNPFVDFGLSSDQGHAFQSSSGIALTTGQRRQRPDPLARPPELPGDAKDEPLGLPRRGPARAVGKVIRTAASRLGGGSGGGADASSPERHHAGVAAPALRSRAGDALVGDTADAHTDEDRETAQEPMVIVIPGEAEAGADAAADVQPFERRSAFDDEAGLQQPWHSSGGTRRASPHAESGAGRRDGGPAGGPPGSSLGCITPDARRAHLQRSLALSQRSLSRMSAAEAACGPPVDWCALPAPATLTVSESSATTSRAAPFRWTPHPIRCCLAGHRP